MKSSPVPLVVDLTEDIIANGNETITVQALQHLGINREEFFGRISCKLILLPSGADLKYPMVETTGAILFGKLLYGGVTRFRLLGSSTSTRAPRRVGEQTSIKSSLKDDVPTWVQFGGSERKYQAVDMGASAVLELSLSGKKEEKIRGGAGPGEMRLTRIHWDPNKMFDYSPNVYDGDTVGDTNVNGMDQDSPEDLLVGNSAMNLGGKKRNDAFANDFKSAVGGLSREIEIIVRRVLDGRVIRPVEEDSGSFSEEGSLEDMTEGELSQASLEADELAILGLTPVKGLLLYGPPGCGKTALAREISRALRARTPKILSAPELLDRWVGSSEKLSKFIVSTLANPAADLISKFFDRLIFFSMQFDNCLQTLKQSLQLVMEMLTKVHSM